MGKVKMPKIKITELNSEVMAEAIANAQARRNKLISELSEEQTAEVVGGRFKLWPPQWGLEVLHRREQ